MRPYLLMAGLAVAGCTATQPPRHAAACPDARASFGCVNAHNLRAMASPADLARGRALGPADGPVEAAAVERYRTDDVKEYRGGTPTDIATGGVTP